MAIMIGSARIDERGKASGGKPGDQKQVSAAYDTKGEVSMQAMYKSSKGWLVFRPKSLTHAGLIAAKMTTACNNKNIGYDQLRRLEIVKNGVDTKLPTGSDCGTLVRECIKEATGIDPGNFTTLTEPDALKKTGLFEEPFVYVSQDKTPVYNGDILVTRTKGHTVIVVSGNPRKTEAVDNHKDDGIKYYPKYTGKSIYLAESLTAVGERDVSKEHRKKIADANGMKNYSYTAKENGQLLKLLKKGKLKKPKP